MDHDSPRIISERIGEPSDPEMKNKFGAFSRLIRQNSGNRYTPLLGIFGLLALSAVAIGSAQFVSQRKSFENSSAAGSEIFVDKKVESALAQKSKIRVVIKLNSEFTPEGDLDTSKKASQRSEIKRLQQIIEDEVEAGNATVVHKYETIPLIDIEVDRSLLEKLKKMKGVVVSVHENPITFPQLYESAPTIRAPEAWAAGFTGAGQVVAVIDSGVDSTHPFLQGQVIDGVCTRECPNGTNFQVGIAAAMPCTWIVAAPGCTHGTQIAGIIAGKDTLDGGKQIAGVAKGAKILAGRVVQKVCADPNNPDNCRLGVEGGDLVAALDWVYQQKDRFPIAAVSLSTGSGVRSATCVDDPLYTNIINNFRSAGIAVVTGAANDALLTQVATISCADNVVVVGSSAGLPGTPLGEFIPNYSNATTQIANYVLAPGDLKKTSVTTPTGPVYYGAFGTSFAAPHVAGAMAVFRSASLGATVPNMISAIKSSGVQITDTRSGANSVKYPRIDVAAALNILRSTASTGAISPTTSCTATTGTSTTCNMPAATLGASTENEDVLGVETSDTETLAGEVLQATTQGTVYGKMMIATVAYIGDPSIPDLQATSMTYCGATMSRLGGATGIANYSGQHLEMWYLFQPSGATCPLKANFTRSRTDLTPADPKDRILTRTVFDNVPNINFISGIVRLAGYKIPGSTFFDLRGLGAKNSRFVCSYSNYPNGGQNVVTPSGTQWKQVWSGKVLNNIQSAIGISDLRTVDSQTMNIRWNGTQSQPWAGVCINLMQGSTGGTTVPPAPPVPPTSVNLKVNGSDGPVTVKPGDWLTMTWVPVSANVCTASGGQWTGGKSIATGLDGQTALPGSTTYKITCSGTRTVSDSVVVKAAPVVDLRIDGLTTQADVDRGIAPKLNWSVVGATSCIASGNWTGTKVATTGGEMVAPMGATGTTYTLTCTGVGGSAKATVKANPTAVTAPSGYRAEYFADPNFKTSLGSKVIPTINFDWGTTGVPTTGGPTNYYSARYTAQITPAKTATYTFITTSDDGVRLYIDDKPVVVDWVYHGRSVKSGTMALTAGKQYNLVIEYVETSGGATMIFQAGIAPNPAALNPKATKLSLGQNGGGFTGYFYTDNNYTNFGTSEIIPVLDNLLVTAPDSKLPYTFKSARFGGVITPTVTSTYSFSVPSGMNLYINGVKKTFTNGAATQAMTAKVGYNITVETKLSTYTQVYLRWKYGTQPYTAVDFRNIKP